MMSGAKREAIRKRLEELEQANGDRLTPDEVVAEAKSKKSVLHDQFEWDDSKAAHQHRLDQARDLITSVRVVIHTDRTIVRGVAYIRDPNASGNEQGYVHIRTLRKEPDAAREAVINEVARVKDSMRRLKHLAAALDLSHEVEYMLNGVIEFEHKVGSVAASAQLN